MLAGLLNTFFLDLNKVVIGKVFGANLLGFYAQARKLQDLTSKNLINIIQKATYPLLAQSDHKGELLESYRKVVILSSITILPVALVLILMAEPIVLVVLGSKWMISADVLKITGVSGLLYHLHSINLNVLKVLGRSDLFLKIELLKKSNTVIALLIGVPLGFEPMLWALVISSFVALIINTWYTEKLIGYGIGHQLKDVGQVFIMLIPFIVSVWLVGHFQWVNSILTLVLSMLVFALIFGLSIFFIKNETTHLVTQKLRPLIPKLL
jgi:O-antigen/teichoic acid export membrane protein